MMPIVALESSGMEWILLAVGGLLTLLLLAGIIIIWRSERGKK